MDIKNLSSNWKNLQQTISKESPSSVKSSKRKADSLDPTDHKSKRPKPITNGHTAKLTREMMASKSRQRSKSLLVEKSADDELPPPRPSTSLSQHRPVATDVENQGRSPTALLGKYLALDCEMVGVGPTPDNDSQVARVSLVNYHGEQLYDSYVYPQLPVTDYRTAVSGIRPQHVEVGRPYSEVRKDVTDMLEGRVLVGHYLKSDMRVLELRHPLRDVRDSARLEKFRLMVGGRAPKLKDLAKMVLGLDIQGGEHNSVEDARAAMMLYKAEKEAYEAENKRLFPRAVKKIRGGTPKKNTRRRGKKYKAT
jgi:RNA exonuclease 4